VQGTVVTVPIATIAALSSTYLPHLDSLGVLDRLVAIDHRKHINNRTVQTYVQQGKVREVGTESSLNTEQLLDVNPALVMTYQIPGATADNVTRLTAAGLTVVVNAEYLETSPLGRAEWLKFMALFFNREREANQHFADVVQRYQKVAAIAAAATDRPTILAGLEIGGTWYMPGGRSYVATYFRDAGGSYLWAADSTTGSIPLSFETVLDRAALANVWLTSSLDWKTHADILATDRRYLNFAAVRTKRVFNNNARVNASGGNDYWEQGILQPDVVLADLVKILHPTLLPSHQLVYYRQLN
jgi:iron complex transport system substrate-binding protein